MGDIRRRQFITLLGGAAAWPQAVRAQQRPAMPVIGLLRDSTAAGSHQFVDGLRAGLGEVGFIENQNVLIEYAFSDGRSDRLPELAASLVAKRVSVIVTAGGIPTIPARAATSTIPIVFAMPADPVALRLVAGLNRPGGNVTGVSYLSSELAGKRLGLLHDLAPKVVDVAMIVNQASPAAPTFIRAFEAGARTLALRSLVLSAATAGEVEAAFAVLTQRLVGALLLASDPVFTTNRSQIAALAARHAIPASYPLREFAEAGGLMSYGPSLRDVYRQVGVYTGRILMGQKPADLPVLQPTKFELVINLKTAKALGLTVPPILFAAANEVIE
jgi:putative ABC transport system substrate-binding protein